MYCFNSPCWCHQNRINPEFKRIKFKTGQKVFDWVILLLFGNKLEMDELQFGYQKKISTNMCTWLAVETIDFYSRNGSEVFVGIMDMSKAFDNVRQSALFWKLIKKVNPHTLNLYAANIQYMEIG